jgi:hypothetical protein
VRLQSRDIQQLLGKHSKFVCNWRGKVFRNAAARGDRVAKWRLHSKRILQDTERLLLWSHHFATRSPLVEAARKTFPRRLQTNFESFTNNCCISRDFRLTGYLISTCESVTFFLNCPVDTNWSSRLAWLATRLTCIQEVPRSSTVEVKCFVVYFRPSRWVLRTQWNKSLSHNEHNFTCYNLRTNHIPSEWSRYEI